MVVRPVGARPVSSLIKHKRRAGLVLAGPGFVVLLLVSIVPLAAAIALSFTSYDMFSPPHFVGLKNYAQLVADPIFWTAVGNTVKFALGQVVIGVVVAIFVALLFNQRLHAGAAMRTMVYLPQAASYVVVALIWNLLLDPVAGPISRASDALFGTPIHFLTSESLALPSIIAISLWRNLGYFMIIILAALKSVPAELLEAAEVDGASAAARFIYISLPMITSVLAFVVITWFLGSLQMFTQSYVMTGGGPVNATRTIVYLMYDQAFAALNIGKASAIAVLLFASVVVLSVSVRVLGLRRVAT